MKCHLKSCLERARSKAIKNKGSKFKVIAIGVVNKTTVVDMAVNVPKTMKRSYHAEERIMGRNGKNLSHIYIVRFNKHGKRLPIKPCDHCIKLAKKHEVKILEYEY